MKILILQDWLRSGGTERQSILLTRAFRAAGEDAQLMTFRPRGALWKTAEDLRPRALQTVDLGWDWFAPGLIRTVRRSDPEVVLAMGRMANCHLWRVKRVLKPGAKAVATFRTGKPLPAWFRRSLRAADAIVANSTEAACTLVEQYGLTADKITVIYNSLVFPATDPSSPAGQLPSKPAGVTVFLCVAMFRPEKNQAGLIRLLAPLASRPGWELWLAGDGPCRAECERLAAELGLRDRVKFLGFQPNPSFLYDSADVAVHASTSEALSNFLIEAQAHGLPAIACQAQGIGECFLPGETGWIIAPGDASAFCAAARPLMTMGDADRARIRARAAAFARERFDPARQTAAYLELFAR